MIIKMKPASTIKSRLGIDKNGDVQASFTNTCYNHMDKYVPRRLGNIGGHLRGETGAIDIQSDRIIYESPYAHAQYIGYTTGPVVNYSTPGTGPYWDERMWSAEKEEIIKEVQDYIIWRQ